MFGFHKREKAAARFADVWDRPDELDGALTDCAQGRAGGFVFGTRVATASGWRPVEKVVIGDSVLTFDAGLQKLTSISRQSLWTRGKPCPRKFWPLLIPAGALGNIDEMLILPDQAVMIESDAAEMIHSDRFPLIPASALVGWRGIRRVIPGRPVQVITLLFQDPQVVVANIGIQFHCPIEEPAQAGQGAYPVLPVEDALMLIDELELLDATCEPAIPAPPKPRVFKPQLPQKRQTDRKMFRLFSPDPATAPGH